METNMVKFHIREGVTFEVTARAVDAEAAKGSQLSGAISIDMTTVRAEIL